MKRFLLIFMFITIINGLNDMLLTYNKLDEIQWYVMIYGAIHFITFAGAYYWILIYILKNK